jgi:hypothetical protein
VKPEELEPEDKILFNDRSTPLTVKEKIEDGVIVEGPKGGEYELYTDDSTDLVSKTDKRRYSSYAENIRKVGEWTENGKESWKHSKTGAEIEISKNSAGFYEIQTKGLDESVIDQPKYGYSEKEFAEEDVEKLIKKNPEGLNE